MNRVPSGTVVYIDGLAVTVGGWIPSLKCYRVSYDGPGHLAAASVIEAAYEDDSSAESEGDVAAVKQRKGA